MLGLEQMDERFAEIVNDLKRRLDDIDIAGAPVFRHLLASILYGGVTVRMYKEENHQRPHVHVYYGKKTSASIAVDTGEVLAGTMPHRLLRETQSWVLEHQGYLHEQWQRLRAGMPPIEFEAIAA